MQAQLDGGCLADISGDGRMFPRAVFGQRQISLYRPAGPWMRCVAMSGNRAMNLLYALASP